MARPLERWTAVALAAAGLLVGACGGGGSDKDKGGSADAKASAPAGPQLEVSGKEFSFTPGALTLKAGQAATIVFKNTGTTEHDLTVADTGFKLTVPNGQTGKKTLTIDKPGTYKMYCAVAGHESAGMKGEVKVE
ncbi:MAG TPA: cupredoxin domain-containing protein [Acidimicrobiia bacterium]|nr:cupredoxin domain-containing protein [Acidimicrobiia bacterium]